MLFSYFLQKIFGFYNERPYLCNAIRGRTLRGNDVIFAWPLSVALLPLVSNGLVAQLVRATDS